MLARSQRNEYRYPDVEDSPRCACTVDACHPKDLIVRTSARFLSFCRQATIDCWRKSQALLKLAQQYFCHDVSTRERHFAMVNSRAGDFRRISPAHPTIGACLSVHSSGRAWKNVRSLWPYRKMPATAACESST